MFAESESIPKIQNNTAVRFAVQVRRKQKAKILQDIRKRMILSHQPNQQGILHPHQNQYWQQFCLKSPQIIDPHILNILSLISPKEQEFQTLFKSLNPNKPINIIFACIVASQYHYANQQFFGLIINLLPHQSRISQHQLSIIRSQYYKIRNYQELNLIFLQAYLPLIRTIQEQALYAISHTFLQWWNDQQLSLCYEICSKICLCLLRYQNCIITKQIKYISIELMRQDETYSTYQLVSKMMKMKDSYQIQVTFLLEDKFKIFLKKGTSQLKLITPTLQILNVLINCYNFYQHIQDIMPQIIQNLYDIYCQQSHLAPNIFQQNILNTFYNIIFHDLPDSHLTFNQLNYCKIFNKTKQSNIWDFIDFAIISISIASQKQIYRKCIHDLQLSKIIKQELTREGFVLNRQVIQTINMFIKAIQIGIKKQLVNQISYQVIQDIKKGLQAHRQIDGECDSQQIFTLLQNCENIEKEQIQQIQFY